MIIEQLVYFFVGYFVGLSLYYFISKRSFKQKGGLPRKEYKGLNRLMVEATKAMKYSFEKSFTTGKVDEQKVKSKQGKRKGCRHCTGVIIGIYEVDESCCLTVFDIGAKFCPECGREL